MTDRSPSGWLRNPQRVWLRRALFQVHLWTGLILGLYLIMMSVTGSAIVFRGEIGRLLTPLQTVEPTGGPRKSTEELVESARRLYPRFAVDDVRVSSDPAAAVEIVMKRSDNRYRDIVFDPYTGKNLGDRVPREPRSVEWVADLHDNLLGGDLGHTINGIAAVAFSLLCLTGAVIWWPGIGRWRQSMTVGWHGSLRRFAWDAHSAVGFWLFVLLFMWGFSAVYLVFPDPFEALTTLAGKRWELTGNAVLYDLAELHFGRLWGTAVKWTWVVLGLAPAFLFVTGFYMWLKRKDLA